MGDIMLDLVKLIMGESDLEILDSPDDVCSSNISFKLVAAISDYNPKLRFGVILSDSAMVISTDGKVFP